MIRGAFRKIGEYAALLIVWVILILLFAALSKNFLTPGTFKTLANSIPTLTVVSAGMTLALIIGGIDLSVGSVLGLTGAVLGVAMLDWHWSFWTGALLCSAVGLLVGLINGAICVQLSIPAFIVTLGMLEAARGLAYMATNSQTKYIGAPVEVLARSTFLGGVSPAFLISIGVILISQIVLTRTVFGRKLIAIGTNENAVRLAGIDPRPPKIAVYALVGLLAGLGAIFYCSRLGAADPNAGYGLELSAIAAVVIGGTSLMGGRGSVVNTFFGVLIIATLQSGLAQMGVSEPVKRVVTGAVIVLAVIVDAWRNRISFSKLGFFKRLFARPH